MRRRHQRAARLISAVSIRHLEFNRRKPPRELRPSLPRFQSAESEAEPLPPSEATLAWKNWQHIRDSVMSPKKAEAIAESVAQIAQAQAEASVAVHTCRARGFRYETGLDAQRVRGARAQRQLDQRNRGQRSRRPQTPPDAGNRQEARGEEITPAINCRSLTQPKSESPTLCCICSSSSLRITFHCWYWVGSEST